MTYSDILKVCEKIDWLDNAGQVELAVKFWNNEKAIISDSRVSKQLNDLIRETTEEDK